MHACCISMYTALTHASPLSVCVRAHECEVGTFDFALPIRSASESHTRLVPTQEKGFAKTIFRLICLDLCQADLCFYA